MVVQIPVTPEFSREISACCGFLGTNVDMTSHGIHKAYDQITRQNFSILLKNTLRFFQESF